MATTTDNIGLIKPTYNEDLDIDDINDNSDVIDEQIQALKDVITNAKALLGQLGVDANGSPLISAASARATLDAAQSESATGSLHDSELAISDIVASTGSVKKSNGSYVPLQSQISTLRDSVARVTPSTGSDAAGAYAFVNKRYITITADRSSSLYGTILLASSSHALLVLIVISGTSYARYIVTNQDSFVPAVTVDGLTITIDLDSQWAHSAVILGGSLKYATVS